MAEAQHKASEHTERKKLELPPISLHTVKQIGSSAPTTPVSHRKPTSVRANCLCSPTTHAGSFRCRYHRNSTTSTSTSTSGLTRNFLSVGAKLSDLAGKQTEICNALHAQ